MTGTGLLASEVAMIRAVLAAHAEVQRVVLFGSRAKGTFRKESDVDLAVAGDLDARGIEALALELDELPLPYRFDLKGLHDIGNRALLEHIERVGRPLYVRS